MSAVPAMVRHPSRLDTGRVRRHADDILRVVIGSIGLLVISLLAVTLPLNAVERDLFRVVNDLPAWIEPGLVVIMQAGAFATAIAATAIALAARRPRLARDLAIAGGVAWLGAKALKALVGRGRPTTLLTGVVTHGTATGLGFPSGHTALAAALAAAAGPYLPRPIRRLLWAVVALVAVARIYVGAHLPSDVVGGLLLGWTIGSAIHLIIGSPTWTITPEAVTAALTARGVQVGSVQRFDADARGSVPFLVETSEGGGLFIKALGKDERNSDWFFKARRIVWYREVENEAHFATPKQQIEHEALLTILARRAGARVPEVVEVAEAGGGVSLLVLARVDAAGLDTLTEEALTPDRVTRLWDEVAALQRAGIAHRDLRLANLLVDGSSRPWIVDFGFAESAADTRRLALDVAQLLVALATVVGPDRAIAGSIGRIDTEVLHQAIPLLQPAALSRSTRLAVRDHGNLLEELRVKLADALGSEIPAAEQLVRFRLRTLALVLLAGFAIHLLLPRVGEIRQTLHIIGTAQPAWLLMALGASILTYLGAGTALKSACPIDLPYGRTMGVTLASSFTNRLAPAGLGRAGLNVLFVQRTTGSRPLALATELLNSAMGLAVHAASLIAALVLFGGGIRSAISLPSGWIVLIAVLGVLLVSGIALSIRRARRVAVRYAREAFAAFAAEIHHPGKTVALILGAVVVNFSYIAALDFSMRAFQANVAAGTVALVYLGGSALAAASPTPGGLGAMEAALVAGFTAAGVPAAESIAGVLAFRLVTFWLPILPGWAAFHFLRRRQYV